MFNPTPKVLAIIAATAAAGFAGATIAGAADSGSDSSSGSQGRASSETALTGDTAAKVKAAALAKQPGTVVRIETDDDGVYEAHIRKADGSEVEVAVDKAFAVTGVEARDGGGHGRGGHGGPGGGAGETALTGATADKVKAAALAKVPGGTIERVETDNGGVYEAHVTKPDGSEVEVLVDKAFEVTAVETR